MSDQKITEGKTKFIAWKSEGDQEVYVCSKNDITAGDGAKHDIIEGKARLANQTTCNVFRLLKDCGIPVAFIEQRTDTSFTAPFCQMLPYEVVVRREAHGSCLKRMPHLRKGHIFSQLKLEFFLKTNNRKWKGQDLECDDPLMFRYGSKIGLYDPKQPDLHQLPAGPFLTILTEEVFNQPNEEQLLGKMGGIAKRVFLILEKAWQLVGRKLVDFKVEFGVNSKGELLLADVIDNDSWRVVDNSGDYIDKQVYRDGGNLNEVTAKYQEVAELTSRFTLPKQCLVLWRGSDKDDLNPFYVKKESIGAKEVDILAITCSAHKQPIQAQEVLRNELSKNPDSVIIAYIGRSNGAGPTLSANTTAPVITVPADCKDFPDDIWSSLRMPSDVPVMTVLEPSNAVLAALQILAMRNPSLYSILRLEQEKRLPTI